MTGMIQLEGASLVIHVIQGGPIAQCWELKHHRRTIIQEVSDVEKIGKKQYSFVSRTMEPINGVILFKP